MEVSGDDRNKSILSKLKSRVIVSQRELRPRWRLLGLLYALVGLYAFLTIDVASRSFFGTPITLGYIGLVFLILGVYLLSWLEP